MEYSFATDANTTLAGITAILEHIIASNSLESRENSTYYFKLDIGTDDTTTFAVSNSPEWCPHPVTRFNLAFWLICLGVNALVQPTGRILGLSYRHHALLRAHPIIYAADAVAVLVSWFATIFFSLRGIRGGASYIVAQRIVDDQGLPDEDTISVTKGHSLIRLATFIPAVVPQFIKLWASSGTFRFERAIGTMYVGSWILFELLLLAVDLERLPALRRQASTTLGARRRRLAQEQAEGREPTMSDALITRDLLQTDLPSVRALHVPEIFALFAITASCGCQLFPSLYYCLSRIGPFPGFERLIFDLKSYPGDSILARVFVGRWYFWTILVIALPLYTIVPAADVFYPLFFDETLVAHLPFVRVSKARYDRFLQSLRSGFGGPPRASQLFFGLLRSTFIFGGTSLVALPPMINDSPFSVSSTLFFALFSGSLVVLAPILLGVNRMFFHTHLEFAVTLLMAFWWVMMEYDEEGSHQPAWLDYLG
jgi:hypothetical protein